MLVYKIEAQQQSLEHEVSRGKSGGWGGGDSLSQIAIVSYGGEGNKSTVYTVRV